MNHHECYNFILIDLEFSWTPLLLQKFVILSFASTFIFSIRVSVEILVWNPPPGSRDENLRMMPTVEMQPPWVSSISCKRYENIPRFHIKSHLTIKWILEIIIQQNSALKKTSSANNTEHHVLSSEQAHSQLDRLYFVVRRQFRTLLWSSPRIINVFWTWKINGSFLTFFKLHIIKIYWHVQQCSRNFFYEIIIITLFLQHDVSWMITET